ncbi:metal-dependent hydrolase [Acinetobacter nosocomialis]|uniref:metal-dependent hydrolase n=1 Tax=Acinetobacter nosocomialis TaxID=106654 RepID=UPI001123E531|nr:metal-dependent hydrolase [Acinetobacter nosocomialis]MDC9814920.1 metal-dependent hydrolase [Acinetobacter nosocomialis]MDE1704726.1 metal-dependent hydrolase [Acinetobacter nosocomialis]MDE9404140.1 metal-dependent hydrolase [Acinetobacter nosocomialis]HDG7212827.1 metal-dependent hydrolase [Acinetobacter nosocomialis]HDG9763711.1 metal-dependent hydrolase [Acinetobacter nosocomialis]
MNAFFQSKPAQDFSKISASIDITVRQLDLSFPDEIPEFWFKNNPLLTMLFTALSSAFPDGERQFIYSVRNYQDKISDPILLKQVRAFIGQEAHHGKEHDTLNAVMLKKGYPVERIYKRFKKMNRMLQQRFSLEHQLACTVCMEHLTAILADYFISIAPEDLELFDVHLRKIWAWHVIEETEHKAVAFDVYQSLVNRPYFLRLVMLETTLSFLIITNRGTKELLKASGKNRDFKSLYVGLKYLFGRQGVIRKISRSYLDFYSKDFHPWQYDNRPQMQKLKDIYLNE